MVARRSPQRAHLLSEFGANLARWRAVNGMSATVLAERAGVTRETLRRLEAGDGSARIESVFAVLAALGIADTVVAASDPYRSETARVRIDAVLGAGGSL
ncbi:helix-turn-helix domain-containing protein [Rathayibacter agropyri]|uniref:helix-turn-helix domain-containing protein n=1 Tax=Rathayibacter agropyri TaxID=1634927 RepID=UPI0015631A1B|nr:helix-turn-helix transcriptional regulator [Rathayibacter agropyri]NRD09456.1 helix-turn-helix transcriptional regulator [Rathayibacter agropyri]